MTSTIRKVLCILIVLGMLIPAFAVFNVSAETVDYNTAADNTVLDTVNFKKDGWNPEFASSSNCGADVSIPDDGASVKFKILTTSSSRAVWGAQPVNPLPLGNDVKYTFVFDLTFGNKNVGFTIFPDGNNGLVIFGDGSFKWYAWNTSKKTGEVKWTDSTDVDATNKQTFAITMDYSAHAFSLYVKRADGSFAFVGTLAEGADWEATELLNYRFYVRKLSGTADDTYTAEVADFKIIKGASFVNVVVSDETTPATEQTTAPAEDTTVSADTTTAVADDTTKAQPAEDSPSTGDSNMIYVLVVVAFATLSAIVVLSKKKAIN